MRSQAFIGSIIAIAAMMAAAPASAQLYKWVDERGVTNYSNQPPPDPKAVKTLRRVEDRLSVYSPDQALLQAIEDDQQNSLKRRNQRAQIESLENQLEAERRAREQAAAAAAREPQAAYERCLADGRTDCDATYGYLPYAPPVAFVRNRHRRQHIPQTVLPPGAIAGHVTADKGYIPGNSAGAATGPNVPRKSAESRVRRPPSDRPLLERR